MGLAAGLVGMAADAMVEDQAWNKFQDEVGGKLRFGDPGVRLFETSENGLDYFTSVPARFQPQDGKWRIAPYYHLFGSDELSQRIIYSF